MEKITDRKQHRPLIFFWLLAQTLSSIFFKSAAYILCQIDVIYWGLSGLVDNLVSSAAFHHARDVYYTHES